MVQPNNGVQKIQAFHYYWFKAYILKSLSQEHSNLFSSNDSKLTTKISWHKETLTATKIQGQPENGVQRANHFPFIGS